MVRTLAILIITFTLLPGHWIIGQNSFQYTINWNEQSSQNDTIDVLPTFKEAQYINNQALPYFSIHRSINPSSAINASIQIIKTKPLQKTIPKEWLENLKAIPDIISNISKEKNNYYAFFTFSPFVKSMDGSISLIESFQIKYSLQPLTNSTTRGPEFANESILNSGSFYKIGVPESKLYKITYSDLTEFGISPGDLDPEKIQIFGNTGGPLPEAVISETQDDLEEIVIEIHGDEDGSFDEGDYILFFGHGPHGFTSSKEFGIDYERNIYDDYNYYFLNPNGAKGKRLLVAATLEEADFVSSTTDQFIRYENDRINLLADFQSTEGSGQLWFSDKFSIDRTLNLSSVFTDQNIVQGSTALFKLQVAARSDSHSKMYVNVDNQERTINFSRVDVTRIESTFADLDQKTYEFNLSSGSPTVILDFPETSTTSEAWLDYLQMEYKAHLIFSGEPIRFRDLSSTNFSTFGFSIETNNQNAEIWDISSPGIIKSIDYKAIGNNLEFNYAPEGIHEFIVFDRTKINAKVEFIGEVENQNLHGIDEANMLIIYNEEFKEQAENLAIHRSGISDLKVVTVEIQQIFNEFSSGRTDPSAIRNFARMVYTRDPEFNYLLLFGDGSYDYKHIRELEYGDENFVPTYETKESLHPIRSFPTDDYYALLDTQEGDDLKGQLDIAVGRIPVRTKDEAEVVVNKIIHYETSLETFGDWRLRNAFASDDEDFNIHMKDADAIAEKVRLGYKNINIEKVHFDAFPQESTPGGERYPGATESINSNIFKGLLTLCYLGHGGPKGWAQERVLKLADIESWENEDKLPLIVTATCSFTGFDDPKITSAGEKAILKEKAGAIGLFTTVRAVFAQQNKRLTEAVYDTMFTRHNGEYMRIGEILRRAKNSNSADTLNINARKFLLIGDPSMHLAIPEMSVIPTILNDQVLDENYQIDTIKALQKIKIGGIVTDQNGNLQSNFNGELSCSLYDKVIQNQTLGNNSQSSPRKFNIQKTVLFKGKAAVENGEWEIEFFLPADINFDYGEGKLSFYAQSFEGGDAQGSFENFIIGGSEDVNEDDEGPIVEVFLNSVDFKSGGISGPDPILLVKLEDDYGINVSGVSVGHDLTAELDDNSKQRYVLNDFYESELNDFRKGTVRFPLNDLENGKHTIKVKAWDLSNNLGEGFLEFYVSDDLSESLRNVFNYPNPFSYSTNFSFEHNFQDSELTATVDIYSMSGRFVRRLDYELFDGGFRINGLEWDGKDEYGGNLANGVYLYKIKLLAKQLGIQKESNFEKLVIIR